MTVTTDSRAETFALGVSGWGVLSPYGLGADEFTAGLRTGRDGTTDAAKLTDAPVPDPRAYALASFRARDHLGRKGTSFLDRRTAFAVLACRQALADSDLVVGDDNRDRVGVVLGTGVGSLQSTSDYSRDTLVQEKPYLVNPILFPNTVLNCAAGQAAIWHGLRGINATLAGGPMATLAALRYAMTVLGRGRAEALLVGAMEEYTPHMAWADHRAGGASTTAGGEGGAVFLVEDAAAMRAAGREPVVEILAVDLGHTGGRTDLATALADRVRRMLRRAGVAPEELATVVTSGAAAEQDALNATIGPDASRVAITDLVGNCPTAAGALQVAAVLAHHRGEPEHDDCLSLIVASTADGSVGAALLKGNGRAARDHR
ncbi:beta-ketoacyl synthase N-terminal-like domain-containing protein [Micromonospora sp. NPDC006766]|uniref:beta-ketoacyl synthase N-terminal-like domain-containing protein n=1 Tax=Micromonospora sp. NPDC006766 TaxID=3154778 RepID=UPI0034019C68